MGRVLDKYYTQRSFKYQNLVKIILFIHAFTGCDTTSAFYDKGKKSFVDIIIKYPALIEDIEFFYNKNATKSRLLPVGENCVKAIYGWNVAQPITLGNLRYICYQKFTLKTGCNLRSLPPISETVNEHTLRVFYQVQKWLGNNDIDPQLYGWENTINGLMPIKCQKEAFPQEILEIVACNCKAGCKSKKCPCRRINLNCTNLCASCTGINCYNREQQPVSLVDEIVEEDELEFNTDSESASSCDTSEQESEVEDMPKNFDNITFHSLVSQEFSDTDILFEDSESEESTSEIIEQPRKKLKRQ